MTLTINHFLIDPLLEVWEGSWVVFKYLNYLFGYLRKMKVFIKIVLTACRYVISFLGGQDYFLSRQFQQIFE